MKIIVPVSSIRTVGVMWSRLIIEIRVGLKLGKMRTRAI